MQQRVFLLSGGPNPLNNKAQPEKETSLRCEAKAEGPDGKGTS